MKGVQCYELFGGIAPKNHSFFNVYVNATALSCLGYCPIKYVGVSVSVEYNNQISTYGINGCRSTCVAASGHD